MLNVINSFLFNLPMVEIKMYNPVHIIVCLFFPIMAIACYFIFKNKSEKTKLIFIWIIMGLAFVSTWLTFATDLITKESTRLNFFSSLPLHMCSINVILYPLFFGLRKKMPKLLSSTTFAYMYFMGSIGAVLAMVVTAPGDCQGTGINFLTYNVFTYWLKHGLIFIIPLLFVSLGFYRPTLPDILKATVFLLALLIVMEGVNLLFSELNKLTGGTKIANFFYTRTGAGTAVLEICWNWIGIELVYLLPLAVIAVPLFAIYYSPFFITDLINKRKNKINA